MVRQFMMSHATHLMFIDNDVGFGPDALLKMAQLDAGYDMVAGVYPLKDGTGEFPVRVPEGTELWSNKDGLIEVDGLPTGFLRISRKCIERMIDKHGDRKFYGRGQSVNDPPHVILFERLYIDGVRYSGDYAFCEKWREIGGKMHVMPDLDFTHAGTQEWSGNLADHWKRRHGVYDAEFADAIEQMRQGKLDGDILSKLANGWGNPFAAHPNTLASIWHTARSGAKVLETGSGLSTIVAALANPKNTVISLESDPYHFFRLSETLKKHGISNVNVVLTEIVDGYYADNRSLHESDFDIVILDGPCRQIADRNLAYDRFGDILRTAKVIVCDDADDGDIKHFFEEFCTSAGRNCNLVGVTQKTTLISTRR
jgi:hypothetical protein